MINKQQLISIVRQIVQPLNRGKFEGTTGLKAKMFELLPGHSASSEKVAPDNFQAANPFGISNKPPRGVLGFFQYLLGNRESPVVINHLHINRPEASAPGETIIYSTDSTGKTVQAKLVFRNDGVLEVRADQLDVIAETSVKVTSPDVEIEGESEVRILSDAKVIIDGPAIELGEASLERLVKGDAFKVLYEAHTHPGGFFGIPTGVPGSPMVVGTHLSSKTKTE